MQSALDTSKSRSLGWHASRSVEEYIRTFRANNLRGTRLDKRVLVFSTTFHPVSGPAEDALYDLMRAMPDIQFDVVTTAYSRAARVTRSPVENATVYRVGTGTPFDKYLLPMLGYWKARELHHEHGYLFAWALMASYAALAAIVLKRATGVPLLITLADQDISNLPIWKRIFLTKILTDADQVYGIDAHEKRASQMSPAMGEGDAFANQLRFAYTNFLVKRRNQ